MEREKRRKVKWTTVCLPETYLPWRQERVARAELSGVNGSAVARRRGRADRSIEWFES